MGREIKRVAANFNWPLNKAWSGYVNDMPRPRRCEACSGSGSSPEARKFSDEWYGYKPFSPRSNGGLPFGWDHPAVLEFAIRNILYDYRTRTMRERTQGSEEAIITEAQRLTSMWDQQWNRHLSQDDVDALVKEGRLHDFTSEFVQGEGWKLKDPPAHPTAEQVNIWSIS
jgi:hypothetical protein